MTPEEKKVLEGFLSKTLKIDTEELASLYNDAGELIDLSIAEKYDAEKMRKFGGEKDSQYKRGVKEGAAKIEKALKDKYTVDSTLEGVELVEFIITEKIAESKETDGDITKHPDFHKHQLEWDKQLKAKDKEWQTKIEEKEAEINKRLIWAKVEKRAYEELDKMRPVLPEDAKKAQKWRENYLNDFRSYDFQEEDNTFRLVKDGELLKNKHGHPITFEEFATEVASGMFDFKAADDRSSAGNKGGQTRITRVPKDDNEYFVMMKEAQSADERIEIMKSYENSKK